MEWYWWLLIGWVLAGLLALLTGLARLAVLLLPRRAGGSRRSASLRKPDPGSRLASRRPARAIDHFRRGKRLERKHEELGYELALTQEQSAPDPAVALHVPLQVDARAADNWDEAH